MDRLQLYFIPVLVSTRLEPAQGSEGQLRKNYFDWESLKLGCSLGWAGLAGLRTAAEWGGGGGCALRPRPITNQHDLDTSDLVIGANIRNHRKLVIDGKKQNTTNILSHNNIWRFEFLLNTY